MSSDLKQNQINQNPVDYDTLLEGSYYYFKPTEKTDRYRRVKIVSKSRIKTKELYNKLKEDLKPLLNSTNKEEKEKASLIIDSDDYVSRSTSRYPANEEGVGLQFDDFTMIFINKIDNPKLYRPLSGGKKNRKSKRNKSKRRRSSSRRKK